MFELHTAIQGVVGIVKSGALLQIGSAMSKLAASIPATLAQSVQTGVALNSQLETVRIGVAAVLKQFDQTGSLRTFSDAMRMSTEAVEMLRIKAAKSPATFQALATAYQGTAGAMAQAGFTIRQQVDLIALMSQTLGGLGIQSDQILQESRALLTGNITEDAMAAKILGITKAQVDAAKEQGQLFDFLSGKFAAFAEAADFGSSSLAQLSSNMQDAFDVAMQEAAAPVFESLKDVVADMTVAVNESGSGWKQLSASLADIVKMAGAVASVLLRYGGLIATVTTGLAALGSARALGNFAEYLRYLTSAEAATLREVAAINRKTEAMLASTAATNQLTAAQMRLRSASAAAMAPAAISAGKASAWAPGVTSAAASAQLAAQTNKAVSSARILSRVWAGTLSIIRGVGVALKGLVMTLGGWVTIITTVAMILWQWAVSARRTREEVARINAETRTLAKGTQDRLAALTSEAEKLDAIANLTEQIKLLEDQRKEANKQVRAAIDRKLALLRAELDTTRQLTSLDLERARSAKEAAAARVKALADLETNLATLTAPADPAARLAAMRQRLGAMPAESPADLADASAALKAQLAAGPTDQDRLAFMAAAPSDPLGRQAYLAGPSVEEQFNERIEAQLADVATLVAAAAERKELETEIAALEKSLGDQKRARDAELARHSLEQLTLEKQAVEAAFSAKEISAEAYELELTAIAEARYAREKSEIEASISDAEIKAAALANLEKSHAATLQGVRREVASATVAQQRDIIDAEIALAEAQRETLRIERERAGERKDLTAVRTLVEQEKTLVGELAEAYRKLAENIRATDPAGAVAAENRAAALEGEAPKIGAGEAPQYDSAGGAIMGGLREYATQMGTMWDQLAGGVRNLAQTITSSLGSSIEGLITRTMRWGQALSNIGSAVLSAVIQTFVQMAAQEIVLFATKESTKTSLAAGGAAARETIAAGETVNEGVQAGIRVGIKAGEETGKTGFSLFGRIARGAISVGETIFEGVQAGIRIGIKVAEEAAKTVATVVGAAARLPIIIGETIAYVFKAAVGAMSALAAIPVVGPALAVGAAAAMIAGGMGLVGKITGARKDGGPVLADGTYLVGEEGPEIVQFGRSGHVHTAQETREMLAARGQGADGSQGPPHPAPQNRFNVGVFVDPAVMARWFSSQEGEGAVMDIFRRNRHEFLT